MTLVVPNTAELDILSAYLNKTAPEDLVVKLYTNNITPGDTDTAATYTEASGYGYSAQALTAASWAITAGDPTVAVYPELTFGFTGALGNVYGYFVVGASTGRIKWAERFTTGPFNILNNGDEIRVTPRLTME